MKIRSPFHTDNINGADIKGFSHDYIQKADDGTGIFTLKPT